MVFSYFCGKCELCVCVIVDWYDEIIVVFEYGMLWEVLVQQQFVFIVCIYLWLMFVNGMGLCVLVLLEGCVKQYVLSDEFIVLQCCYMVLLMDVFVCGQVVGQVCVDLLLSLLCLMVFGLMEYVLWDVIFGYCKFDMEMMVMQLIDMLWVVVQLLVLEQVVFVCFRNEVVEVVWWLEG